MRNDIQFKRFNFVKFTIVNVLVGTMRATTNLERIQLRRNQKGLSQNEFVELVGISKEQLSGYISKDVQPPLDVSKRLSNTLYRTAKFTISRYTGDKATETLIDSELLRQLKEMDQLPPQEKNTRIKVDSAFIRDYKTTQSHAI